MIKNLWSNTNLFCGNHEEQIEMHCKTGPKSVFYACPEYEKKYQGKRACPNRLSIDDYEGILKCISEKIESDTASHVQTDLTNWKFNYRQVECKIMKQHPNGHIDIQVLNKKVMV